MNYKGNLQKGNRINFETIFNKARDFKICNPDLAGVQLFEKFHAHEMIEKIPERERIFVLKNVLKIFCDDPTDVFPIQLNEEINQVEITSDTQWEKLQKIIEQSIKARKKDMD